MIPEGFKDIKTHEPPLWEDIVFALDDGRHVIGYYSGKMHGKDEYLNTSDEHIHGVIAWKYTHE